MYFLHIQNTHMTFLKTKLKKIGIITLNPPDLSTVWRFTHQCTKIGT
jgi:hypothetical protein